MDPLLHDWYTRDGVVDIFRYEGHEYCNGPECRRCGFSFCHHCHPEYYQNACDEQTDYLFNL